jgi:hypothetical protein
MNRCTKAVLPKSRDSRAGGVGISADHVIRLLRFRGSGVNPMNHDPITGTPALRQEEGGQLVEMSLSYLRVLQRGACGRYGSEP